MALGCGSLCAAHPEGWDTAPPETQERLAKIETGDEPAEAQTPEHDPDSDPSTKPHVLADILVYDSASKNCAGEPGNIGACIETDRYGFKRELYLCDDAGNLLISRCIDTDCKKCAWPRKDDYS